MGQEHKEYTWNLIAKKLTGEATPEELRELEILLRNNPDLHYPMQTITDLWKGTNSRDRKQAEIAFNRHLDRMEDLKIDYHLPVTPTPEVSAEGGTTNAPAVADTYPWQESTSKRRFSTRHAVTLAAVLCGLVFMTWFYTRTSHSSDAIAATPVVRTPDQAGSEIFTASGSRTHLALPDGTLVWLNAGSRVNYPKNFGATLREVSLTGEAFFDVAPNANKPFVIHTTRIDIKVLGTRFNVKSYPSDKTTEATLIRGSIEVSIKNKNRDKIIMKPNEKLVVSNEDSISLERTPRRKDIRESASLVTIGKPTYEKNSGAIIETSWVDNKLIFQDEDFTDLARQMERWYGVSIHFQSDAQGELRFTGIFEKETIQQALDALKLTANFHYSIEGTEITIHD